MAYGTTEESYRKATDLINRVRHQEGATPSRTLRENTEYEGRQIMVHMEQQATIIPQEHGFTPDGALTEVAPVSGMDALTELLPCYSLLVRPKSRSERHLKS